MTFRQAVIRLKSAGIESARADAAMLFEHFLNIEPSRLPLMYDEEIESVELCSAIERRAGREPIQYILGEWEFFGLRFKVSPDCLCPRPDTEILVERALSMLEGKGRFLELCTGSGCISVAILKNRPELSGIATDKFEATLNIARHNARANDIDDRLRFELADLFDRPDYIGTEKFDAIISNPPYIPTKEVEGLSPEVKKEPAAALDGGEDGLDFYRHIVKNYSEYLTDDGAFIFEIGFDQGDDLCAIADGEGFVATIVKDLGGNDRVAVLLRRS